MSEVKRGKKVFSKEIMRHEKSFLSKLRRKRRTTSQKSRKAPGTSHFFAISGRTDLRKGVSEAKFDGQADFDVQKIPAPPKSAENHEKPKKKS